MTVRRLLLLMVCSAGFAQGIETNAAEPVASENVVLELGAGVRMELVRIEKGSYFMGSLQGVDDEVPKHRVVISQPFWLARTEVTRRQYYQVMKERPWPASRKGGDLPQARVAWSDAKEFCGKLTKRERAAGRLPEGYAYTLPSEAQWEYACRAGTRGTGEETLDSMAWYKENSGGSSHPVATREPNAWGLYDMAGNVWEWCEDRYDDEYYGRSPRVDPVNVRSGMYRVDRGGSWESPATCCRWANRDRSDQSYTGTSVGFRVCLSSRSPAEKTR